MLVGPITTSPATGSAGSASGVGYSIPVIRGRVYQIQVKYFGSPPSTTDVTIQTRGVTAPSVTLLTLTDNNIDVTRNVLVGAYSTSGSPITGVYAPIAIEDTIQVSVNQTNPDVYVKVWLYVTPD